MLLLPLSGFVADQLGYVYYRKLLADYSQGTVTVAGIGVAQVAHGGVATRLLPARYADEPTLLWKTSEAYWGRGVLFLDGLAYLYGCFFNPDAQPSCGVAINTSPSWFTVANCPRSSAPPGKARRS